MAADKQASPTNDAATRAAYLSALEHQQSSSGGGGGGGGGGGAASGESRQLGDDMTDGVDKFLQSTFKVLTLLGIHINPDIKDKGAIPHTTNVGGSLAMSAAAIFKPESGGGWLSMIWEALKKQFVREPIDLTANTGGAEGGRPEGSSGGDGGGSGGDGDSYVSPAEYHAGPRGGGEFHGHSPHGGDMPETLVSYGDKMVASSVPMEEIGTLRPSASPTAGGREADAGVTV